MPGQPIPLPLTAAEFAVLSANEQPDGHRVTVTDDGEKEWEARGADGARVWVELHTGHVADHEAAYSHGGAGELVVSEVDSSPPVNVWTEDGTDWVYTET